ncbi:hypothetical protein DOTSEDRAFT_76504 [Dothistroma septosporum NZE10]|uniref:Uncharacterized protein n=1 Tax=Dothistroma septosporum (strain NZE10 / CBS 128990) TaxID=675120 RepID=N1Q086_DOTSN|nr:hypothetical protein DOTSEDRAFT_76504 [Dothistroma septosporum NZE10]
MPRPFTILKSTVTAPRHTSSKRSSSSPTDNPINMFSTDLEKGADAQTSSGIGPNTSSHQAGADFPPKYESQVNYEMQRVGQAQRHVAKAVDIDYDFLAPSRKQSKRPMWFWAIIVGAVVVMIIGAVIIAVHGANNKQTEEIQVRSSSSPLVTQPKANTTQSPMVTRSEPSASQASMTIMPDLVTVTVEPMTSFVYATVTYPTPSTSTGVVVASEQASTSTPIVTITLTSTESKSTISKSTSSPTSSTVTTVATFEAPVTASPDPTVTIVSTVNLSESALRASISAEMSRVSEHLIARPITQSVVSMTTETAAGASRIPVVSTASGMLFRCTVPGLACGK